MLNIISSRFLLVILCITGFLAGTSAQVSFTKFPKSFELIPRIGTESNVSYVISGSIQNNDFESLQVKVFQEDAGLINTYSENLFSWSTNFSLSIVIPVVTKNHRIECYGVKNGQEILIQTVDNIVAGDIYVINGQSNAEANVIVLPEDRNPYQRGIDSGGNWNDLKFSNPGEWAGRIAKQITDTYQVPVAIFNFAEGGRPIEYFLQNHQPSGSNNFSRVKNTFHNLGISNRIKSLIWFQGVSDGWQASVQSYQSEFEQLVAAYRNTYGMDDIYLFQVRSESCTHPYPYVLEAQRKAASEDSKVHIMSTGNANHDGCHFHYEDGYQTLGDRMFRLMAKDLYNGNFSQVESPDVQQIEKIGSNKLQITWSPANTQLSTTGNPWSDFNIEGLGFQPYSGSASGNTITLNFSQTIPSDATLTYRCHPGNANNYIFNGSGVGALSFYDFSIGGTVADPCLTDNTDPQIHNCPNNISVYTSSSTANVSWNAPTVSDNCSAASLQSNFTAGSSFPIGNSTVSYVATDQSGNTSNCSFIVTVIENTNPSSCSDNLLLNSALNNSNSWTGDFNIEFSGNLGSNILEVCSAGLNARQILEATPGKKYKLNVDARSGAASGFLILKYLNASYTPLEQNFENINSGNSYANYQVIAEAPPGTAFVEVSVNKNSGGACVQAGNWCLTEDGNIVIPPVASGCDDNLLENGGFENGLDDWTPFFDANISSQSITGNNSLQIGSSGNRVLTSMPITSGENYYLNATAAGNGKVALAIKYLNSVWTPIFYEVQELNLNNEEKAFSEMMETAPPNAKYVEIALINITASTARFDDVCLTTETGGSGPGTNQGTILGSVDCSIESDYPWEEWISKVNINGLNKTSSKKVYSNFTNTIFSLDAANNEIEITASWSYITRPLHVNVYIDWNGDQDYSSDEKLNGVISAPSSGNGVSNSWSSSFDLPSGTTPGLKAMRVLLSREDDPSPCGSLAHGEVEDYLVNISSGSIFRQANESDEWIDRVHVFPNPATDYLTIDLSEAPEEELELILSNALGRILPATKQSLPSGTDGIVIPVAELEDGIYTLLFYFKNKKPVGKKIIVQRGK